MAISLYQNISPDNIIKFIAIRTKKYHLERHVIFITPGGQEGSKMCSRGTSWRLFFPV